MTTRGHKEEMGTKLEAGILADLRDWQHSARKSPSSVSSERLVKLEKQSFRDRQ